ncbi:MAG: helix-turn-helix domain-containing protein [Bacteroidales bacterium]|nr:helix-turn-helix domain-containing protein [Bacteroidales bacterium]MDD2424642.1 helix-turn-helix domain-containing protein [Bacteroidales bacterium]MDD3989138.1 helix-turn-helix domain-containing protein [Bacteroidales bacterium]MDD4638854.1 helix-turn-helix domain-containing protein [Bacteroidales bacterium]
MEMLECASWIGLAQSLFAGILVLTKENTTISDRILSGFLFLMAIVFLNTSLYFRIYDNSLLSASFLLFNPYIFIYIRSLTNRTFTLKYTHLLHLIPFVLFEILAFVKHIPFTSSGFLSPGPDFFYRIAFVSVNLISWSVYIPLSIILVHRHRLSLRNEVSNIESNETLGWILFISIFYVVYSIAIIASGITEFFSGPDIHITEIINYTTLLLLVYIISFYGVRQKELTKLFNPQTDPLPAHYKNSILKDEQRREIKDKITGYFNSQKPYLDPELCMDTLSSALNIPKYQLTEVLNRELGRNFFQFVNHYRVEEVKKMLSYKSLPYSIEAIGYECGFSSKTSFYSFFKAETGMPPSAYRESLLRDQ